jgi:hypothetical protein
VRVHRRPARLLAARRAGQQRRQQQLALALLAAQHGDGELAWRAFDHSYFLGGYTEHAWGANTVRSPGAFRGPFRAAQTAPTVLVVGTTYDPATPYEDAQRLTGRLENARLLTMDGDGHGAYGGESECIDTSVDAYLERGVLPEPGRRCRQETPFERPR